MDNNKKFVGFESLGEVKKDFKNNEPFKEGSIRTPAMLVSPVSKKLLKFFSEEYIDIFDNYLKKHPESIVY